MSIEIKKNRKLDLDIPEFICDGNVLGKHLLKYDMLQSLNGYKFTALVGKPGAGKTSTLVSWLNGRKEKKVFRKVFNHVFVVMPTSSRESMKTNIFKNHPPEKMSDELTYENINSIYERLKEATEKKEKSLLILDDVGSSLKNKEIQKLLRLIIYNRRHLKVSIVILLQSFLSCPKEVRKLLNNIVIVGRPSKVEYENLFEECFEIKKDLSLEIVNLVYQDLHDSIFLSIDTQRIFTNFDEIIIHNDDEST
jgi:hypothetical protein